MLPFERVSCAVLRMGSLGLGVGSQGALDIANPARLKTVLLVPVDGLLQAFLPGCFLRPAQSSKLLVADIVPREHMVRQCVR